VHDIFMTPENFPDSIQWPSENTIWWPLVYTIFHARWRRQRFLICILFSVQRTYAWGYSVYSSVLSLNYGHTSVYITTVVYIQYNISYYYYYYYYRILRFTSALPSAYITYARIITLLVIYVYNIIYVYTLRFHTTRDAVGSRINRLVLYIRNT